MKGGPLVEVVHPASLPALDPQSVDIQMDPARPTLSPTMYAECMKTPRYQPPRNITWRFVDRVKPQLRGMGRDRT